MALYGHDPDAAVADGSDLALYGSDGAEESGEDADPEYSEGSEATIALIQTLRQHKSLFGGMEGEDEDDEAGFEVEDEDDHEEDEGEDIADEDGEEEDEGASESDGEDVDEDVDDAADDTEGDFDSQEDQDA